MYYCPLSGKQIKGEHRSNSSCELQAGKGEVEFLMLRLKRSKEELAKRRVTFLTLK